MKEKSLSRLRLLATPSTAAHQAPLSMGFSRQEYWRGVPFPSPGDLPNPRIKPESPVLAGRFFTTESPGKLPGNIYPFPKLIWLGIHFCLETTSFLGVCVPCTSFESSLKCKWSRSQGSQDPPPVPRSRNGGGANAKASRSFCFFMPGDQRE